ncbi:hypothetical protein LPJ74_003161 [Coemansia sp. RSA 1843]|nr:hypothetical protein LPJ74_003161 [Coemansia sp. RSA 1843]
MHDDKPIKFDEHSATESERFYWITQQIQASLPKLQEVAVTDSRPGPSDAMDFSGITWKADEFLSAIFAKATAFTIMTKALQFASNYSFIQNGTGLTRIECHCSVKNDCLARVLEQSVSTLESLKFEGLFLENVKSNKVFAGGKFSQLCYVSAHITGISSAIEANIHQFEELLVDLISPATIFLSLDHFYLGKCIVDPAVASPNLETIQVLRLSGVEISLPDLLDVIKALPNLIKLSLWLTVERDGTTSIPFSDIIDDLYTQYYPLSQRFKQLEVRMVSVYDMQAMTMVSQSLGSNNTPSGSRRHSLLSADGNLQLDNTYNYTSSWNLLGGDNLSQWRRTYVASEVGDTDGVQSTSLALPDETRFTTCMAVSEDQPLLAIGSGSYETNMFFVQSLDDQLDVKASFASKFPIYSLGFKSNLLMAGTDRNTSVLYKVDRARLLGFPPENAIDDDGGSGDDGPLVRCVGTFKNKAAKSIDIAAPGNHVPTRRVSCVEFAPPFSSASSPGEGNKQANGGWPPPSAGANSEMFLACVGGVVNIWDAAHSQHALRMEKVSNQPLTRASWNPEAPANLIAASGVDGVINILDLRRRGRAVAWRTALPALGGNDAADEGWAINDIAWSPFVPYWLATASESGLVRVWDMRYAASDGAAVATLRHPTNHGSITSVAWSPAHVDMLATGASDRSWRLHALRTGASTDESSSDTPIVAEQRAAEDIGSVVSVHGKGNTFYTLSSCGDLYAHRVAPSALKHTATFRMDNETAKRAEAAVHARDFKAASENVLELVERLKEQQQPVSENADTIKTLCDLFKAKPRLTHSSWALPPPSVALMSSGSAIADTMDTSAGGTAGGAGGSKSEMSDAAHQDFANDLKYLGYGLPPGFPLETTASRQPALWQALERLNMMNLRIKLAAMVDLADEESSKKKGGSPVGADGRPLWKNIADREKQIVQYVQAEPTLFDAKLLRSIVKLVLPHDCIAGLSLGLGVCQAYLRHERRQKQQQVNNQSIVCTSLDGLVHVLLFPTVFDTDTSTSAPEAVTAAGAAAREIATPDVPEVRQRIAECLATCPEAVFEMVRLEISIQQIVMRSGEQAKVAEDIVQAMKDHARTVETLVRSSSSGMAMFQIHSAYPATTTLSASAVRLYLNSLVPMRAYDEYLVNTQWWRVAPPRVATDGSHVVGTDYGWLSSFSLARIVNRQAATLVVPRFRRQIDVVLSTIRKEPLSLEPRLYRDTLLKVARVNLMMRCDKPLEFSVPGSSKGTSANETAVVSSVVTTSISAKTLVDAFDEIGNAFLMLLEALTRHSSHRDAFKRAASEAQPLYESLATLVRSERDRADPRRAGRALKEFEQMTDAHKANVLTVSKYLRKLEHYAKSSSGATAAQEQPSSQAQQQQNMQHMQQGQAQQPHEQYQQQ